MAYFRNSIVNLLNLHYGIHALAMTGGGAFYAVYLLKSGVPLPGVLVAMAAILLGRFIIRPAIIPLTIRFGLRPLLIAGTLIGAMQYPVLAHVHGVGWTLLGLCALSSLGDTVYWSTYHAYFAALGDADHRGQQVSVREAITAVVGIISPLTTGWVLVRYGANAAFGATAFAQTLAALPLLKTPNVAVMPRVPGVLKVALPAVLLFVGDGWIGAGLVFVWQLALFGVLHDSYLGFGGAMAIAALAGAVAGLVLGRHIDAGRGGRMVWIALTGLAGIAVLRAASLGHPALAVFANALASVGTCLYIPVLMTAVYNQAKKSACTLRFHVGTEGGWDVGGGAACLVAAAMLALGAPLWLTLLLPLGGILLNLILLQRYYARLAAPLATSRAEHSAAVSRID
ncbi:MAG: hypothetical protein J0H79_13775 [Alphaproteobacteria bacterium]|jgi:hypothetical protein|nr:hypothetical protein [Alphaproteobacteria bacterium]MBN9568664.1 hypothetical protein [Alphaproteobacteria bacterium]MBN9578926.1 hypothetical protein [Alphaproteobacteria bacterium]OJU56916.1 MAG: hypothetical protein BGO00_09880 [Alphaproteobacteria bacterium 62-8]